VRKKKAWEWELNRGWGSIYVTIIDNAIQKYANLFLGMIPMYIY